MGNERKSLTSLLKVKDIDDLIAFLKCKGKNHNNYYHYTSWDSFLKIYENKTFLLTRGNSLNINDQHEALMKGRMSEWNKTYIGSFAYGSAENMAMWGLYGQPTEDAIRIEISKEMMNKWFKEIQEAYFAEMSIKIDNVSLADIIYVDGKDESDDLILTHRDTHLHTKDIQGLINVNKRPEMTGYIKNYAWHYENEVRIKVKLPYDYGYDKIFVKIPEEVLNSMKIMVGPSFLGKGDQLYYQLLDQERIDFSGFRNLIKYRQLCSYCLHEKFIKK